MMLTSPTTTSWTKTSPIELLVTRACEPSLPEPNYALHLEVAEYINTKKANNPREAAMLVARLANHRNPHVAILALSLLDTLVQSCGYPFHLQIATKEFLNELVRRFPERPPPFPGPVMSRILDLIHGWKEGICTDSRWREDLGNIRDMHRLLTFKGYRFRDNPRRHQSANPVANLKSAEELEEEDREAQQAKLQELIRRGTPRDLAAAQELMKALAGANPDAKPDYRSQALTELNKLEQKVILLNEMLDNVDVARGEQFASGDAYDQVSSILKTARPKLQKWISDAESDDPESLDTFLQINDQINTVLNRYEAFKQGDYAAAANPIPKELSGGTSKNETSLIDFDDPPSTTTAPTTSGPDDLAGLFSTSTSSSQPPMPAMMPNTVPAHVTPQAQVVPSMATGTLFGGAGLQAPAPMARNGGGGGIGGVFNLNMIGGAPGLSRPSVSPPQVSSTPPAAIKLPSTPGSNSPAPNYFNPPHTHVGAPTPGVGMGMGMMGVMTPSAPGASQTQQRPTGASNLSTSSQAQGKDPFADLAGLF